MIYNTRTGQEVVNAPDLPGTSYTVMPPLDAPDTFQVFVRAENSSATSDWSDPLYFDLVLPEPPTITGPPSPTADATPTVTWNPAEGAASYQLQVYNYNLGQLKHDVTGLIGTAHEVTPALTAGYTYQVYMRSANTEGEYGSWSSAYFFDLIVPAAPLLTAPPAETADATPLVAWDGVEGAASYHLQVYNVAAGRIDYEASGIAGTSHELVTALVTDTYRAYVRAQNEAGQYGSWGGPREFKVVLPAAPTVTAPPDPTTDRTPVVEWTAVDGAGTYELLLYQTNLGKLIENPTGIVGTSYTVGTILAYDLHEVYARAVNEAGQPGGWSAVYYFNVIQPTVSIEASTPDAFEDGEKPGTFTISRSGNTELALTVYYDVTGSALEGSDYASLPISRSVEIGAGSPSARIDINPFDDTTPEPSETVVLTLVDDPNDPDNYTVVAPNSATVAIGDNDSVVTIAVTAGKEAISESATGVGQFTVTRTGDNATDLQVQYAVYVPTSPTHTGIARPKDDYTELPGTVTIKAGSDTATVDVDPVDDTLKEGDEKVTVALEKDGAYKVGEARDATVTITDDATDTGVRVSIKATRPDAYEAGRNYGRFRVYREGNTGVELTVKYDVPTGSATPGIDYTGLPGSVKIPKDALSAPIEVIPTPDQNAEPDETMVLTLAQDASYLLGTDKQATVTIHDSDSVVTVRATDAEAGEAGPNPGVFTISRAGNLSSKLPVFYEVGGTVTRPDDAEEIGRIEIPAGKDSVTVTVIPEDDDKPEPTETVILVLRQGLRYRRGDPHHATIRIADNDGGTGGSDLAHVTGDLRAFRPFTRHLDLVAVPDDVEALATGGAGIRRNGDDDDNDGMEDRNDSDGVDPSDAYLAGDDDLLALWIHVDPAEADFMEENIEIRLKRTNDDVNVWDRRTRTAALLTTSNDVKIDFNGGNSRWVYVEWVEMNAAAAESHLELYAKDLDTGEVKSLDKVRFYPFNSTVVGFVGEYQSAGDTSTGMHEMITTLYEGGYDARIFDEDDVGRDIPDAFGTNPSGELRSVQALYNAFEYRGVTGAAIFGYSHGGGATYDLSDYIANSWGSEATPVALKFTAYVDGVAKGSSLAEKREPVGTPYHHNQFQVRLDPEWWDFLGDPFEGDRVAEAEYNDNVQSGADGNFAFEHIEHTNRDGDGIAENDEVQSRLLSALKTKLGGR